MGDAVLTPLDDETVQVLVSPAQGELEGGMEVGDGERFDEVGRRAERECP